MKHNYKIAILKHNLSNKSYFKDKFRVSQNHQFNKLDK